MTKAELIRFITDGHMNSAPSLFDGDDKALSYFLKSVTIKSLNLAIQGDTREILIAFTWDLSEEGIYLDMISPHKRTTDPYHGCYWSLIYDRIIPLDEIAIAKLKRYALLYRLFN